MKVETAVLNMVEAARATDMSPAKLAKSLNLAIVKVASLSPVGDQAIKIISTDLVKDLLKQELGVVARIAKGPRAPRGSKQNKEAAPIKEKTFEDEIAEAFGDKPTPTVTAKRRGRPPKSEKKAVTRKPREKATVAEAAA
jgi:hypothetical protein